MKVDCAAAFLIAVFQRNEKSIHTVLAERSALIFLWNSGFQRWTYVSHLPDRFVCFSVVNGGISILLLPQMSFVSWSWYVSLLSRSNAFDASIAVGFWARMFCLLCFVSFSIAQKMKWRKRSAHITCSLHHSAQHQIELNYLCGVCLCVCESGYVCRFHVPDGKRYPWHVCVCVF